MKDKDIIPGYFYQHSIFGKILILENVTDEWDYFKRDGISVWRAQQYSPNRVVLCINSKYFDYPL